MDVVPDDVAAELIADVGAWMSPKLDVAVTLLPDGRPPVHLGPGGTSTATVRGPAAVIAGWLTGRTPADRLDTAGDVPELPRWL